jgi:hypothetical protein
MPNPPGSFIWYELMTPDADAAARFYGRVVGWTIAEQADPNAPPGRDYRMIGRKDGGSAGGLMKLSPEMVAGGARPSWLACFYAPDVDATVKRIEAAGGKSIMRMTIPVGEIAMVADPMGAPFDVMRPVPPPGKKDATSDVFDAKKAGHVRWHQLQSPDLARAKAFYAEHFGYRFTDSMPMGPLGDYWFIDHASGRLGGMMQLPPTDGTAGWVLYFGVESATAAKRAIEANGGKITHDLHEVPGGDWVVIAEDPQGAPFGVVGPKGD